MGYVVREVNWTHVANAMEQPCQLSQLFYAALYLPSVSQKFLCLGKCIHSELEISKLHTLWQKACCITIFKVGLEVVMQP